MDQPRPDPNRAISRRHFLQTGSSALMGATLLGALPLKRSAHAAGSDLLKLALVGCGGRGTGAASQALSTAGATKLVALADVRPEQLEKGLNALKGKHEDQVAVPPEHQFTDFDGYQKAIALADVRPEQLEKGLNALKGKHEDQVAVPPEHQFTDFDGYQKAIALADVVILASTPGFRASHVHEAVL